MNRNTCLAVLTVLAVAMVGCQVDVRTGEEAEEQMEEMQERIEERQEQN